MRIQSSRAICSQISGLSFDASCPSVTEASSSPCHQRRLWLCSYEGWWMRAVKLCLHGSYQGPPQRQCCWLVGTLAQRQAANSTDAGALVSEHKGKHRKITAVGEFFCCLLQITKLFEDPSGSLCFQLGRVLYQKCIMWCLRKTFNLRAIKRLKSTQWR